MPAVAIEMLIVILLIALNGVFAMAEMAVVTARRARLEQQANAGDRNARAALELAREPSQFLSTIQIGITTVGILAGAFGGATLSQLVAANVRAIPNLAPYAEAIGLAVVVLAITYLTLVFGELAPKRLALSNPERIAATVAIPMQALSRVASPVVRVLSASTDFVLGVFGFKATEETPVSEDEIRILIAQGTRAGVFEETEEDIVDAVFRLGDRRVSSLMTPRPDVIWLDLEQSPETAIEVVLHSNHTRFPVCRGELDNAVGIAATKDILVRWVADDTIDLAGIIQPPLFVPETLHAFRLLELLKQQAAEMALVVDEYGGIQGVVTPTDIFEAIVGDLPSPSELAEPAALQREDGSWLVDGLLAIEELKELLELNELPEEESGDYYTVGGMMMKNLGRIPRVGDHFEGNGRRFEVVDMDGNRVDKVLIMPSSPSDDDARA
jgi:putative hemolysin